MTKVETLALGLPVNDLQRFGGVVSPAASEKSRRPISAWHLSSPQAGQLLQE